MSRLVKVATVQPPIPKGEKGGVVTNKEMVRRGLTLLESAGKEKVDITCLPEIFNVLGLSLEESLKKASNPELLCLKISRIAREYRMYIVYPTLEKRKEEFYISANIIDREGKIAGKYDKAHLTRAEKRNYGATPGNNYPVFKTNFGKIGVMICYDCYFSEVARILTLNGAEIIFYPSLQRHFSEVYFEIQTRARALDHSVYIVRSSYGVEESHLWFPGMILGRSCIIDRDGTIIADLGHK